MRRNGFPASHPIFPAPGTRVLSIIYLTGQAMLSVSRLPRAVSRLRTSSQSIATGSGRQPQGFDLGLELLQSPVTAK